MTVQDQILIAEIWIEIQKADQSIESARKAFADAEAGKALTLKKLDDTLLAIKKLDSQLPEALRPFAHVCNLTPGTRYTFFAIDLPGRNKVKGAGYLGDGYAIEWEYQEPAGRIVKTTSVAEAIVCSATSTPEASPEIGLPF